MANLYNTSPNNYSSSTYPHEPDDISLFLQQILLRSSSSSSSFPQPEMAPGHAQISGLNSFASFSFTAANVSSSSVGNPDNEVDDCDYESEEGVEALVEETAAKPTPPRSCSKRSRAAEVHNQSEKRRRSRINEKMKALQNLIPNSNKTDKASMLDEAIEYLKQLQIQVQMLTMRNGLSLYPICLPGMVQPNQTSQMRMDVYDTDKLVDMNMAKAFCMDQNISTPVTDFSHMIGSKSSMELESSVEQQQFGAFQLSGSTKGICKETVLSCRPPLIEGRSTSNSGAKATCSIPCETQTSNLKKNILEACQGGDDHLLPNFVNNPIFSTHLNI